MIYPRYIFPGSFDPMHLAHYHTLLTAEKIFGTVFLLICQNVSKGSGFFSLGEREGIAELFVPHDNILIAASNAEVVTYFENATRIIRGYRNEAEVAEMALSAKAHGVERFSYKLSLFRVPKNLEVISSTKLRQLVLSGKDETAMRWTYPKVVEKIRNKIS